MPPQICRSTAPISSTLQRSTGRRSVLLAGLVLLLGACAQEAPPPPAPAAPPVKVVNSQLGIEVTAVPDELEVEPTQDATIVLVLKDKTQEGRIVIEAGPVEKGGINLVEAAQQHKAAALAREGGVYKGRTELGAPLGTAFTSRALWTEGGRTLEEIKVFLIHPSRNRKLIVDYRYPAGADTPKRMNDHIYALVGELGPIAEEPAPANSAPATSAPAASPAATPGS